MASPAQIDANRQNAQKSTGPRTPEGKTTVSQNALRHGLCSGIPLMFDEAGDDVQQLLAALIEENQPVGVNEEILVYKMAEHFFFQKRAGFRMTEELDGAFQGEKNAAEIGLLLRYYTAADRGFARTLNDLRKLQKERKLQEIGFVSLKLEEASAAPPAEPQTPASAPPKTEPPAETRPAHTQDRAEPAAAGATETRRNIETELPGQPRTPPKAA
jgi:hypothetical protein